MDLDTQTWMQVFQNTVDQSTKLFIAFSFNVSEVARSDFCLIESPRPRKQQCSWCKGKEVKGLQGNLSWSSK